MLVRGRPSSTMNVLMARAVEVAVIGILSYVGFLADTTKTIRETQATVAEIQTKVNAAATKASSCEEQIQEHIRAQSK